MRICLLLILLLASRFANCQEWIMNGNLLHDGRYEDVYFIDSLNGWTLNSRGEIFKTTNGGERWDTVYTSTKYLRSIEFINDSVGFAGSLNGDLLRSADGGNSWTEIQDHIPHDLDGICGLSHAGDNVYGVGIWSDPAYFIKSEDQGLTWSYSDLTEHAEGLVDCHFLDENIGFICGTHQDLGGVILKTVDSGTTWYPVFYSGLQIEYVWKLFFVNSTVAYASIESFDAETSIAKTIDGGESWTKLSVTNEPLDIQGIGFIDELKGWVGPRNKPLYETRDGGQTWNETNYMDNINRFFKTSDGLLFASGSGVYKYLGGTSGIMQQTSSERYHDIVNVYPNPFSKELKISIRIDRQTRTKMDIVSIDGLVKLPIYNGTLQEGTYDFKLQEKDLTQFRNTVCYIILRTNEGFLSKELVAH